MPHVKLTVDDIRFGRYAWVDDSHSVASILIQQGKLAENQDIRCLFVRTQDGEYVEIYGVREYKPYMHVEVKPILVQCYECERLMSPEIAYQDVGASWRCGACLKL